MFFIYLQIMNQTEKSTYDVPLCQIIFLAPESTILSESANSGSTKDISYEDI